jgi:hypothetical protein
MCSVVVQVMEDFENVEGICEVRLRHCLTQLRRCMQQVEAAYLSGMSGGRSPKAAANLIRGLIPRCVFSTKNIVHK